VGLVTLSSSPILIFLYVESIMICKNCRKVNRAFGVMRVDLLPDFVGLKVYGRLDTQDSGFRVDEVG
jgi:hypothetical protein